MYLVSSCSCLCPIHWSQVLSREWRCSWCSADRRWSNYIWVITNFIAYWGAPYIRGLTVHIVKMSYFQQYVLSLTDITHECMHIILLPPITFSQWNKPWSNILWSVGQNDHTNISINCRVDCRLASSQWETSLQSNTVSHWLGTNLESAITWRCTPKFYNNTTRTKIIPIIALTSNEKLYITTLFFL